MYIDPIYGRDTLVDLDGELCVLHEVPLNEQPRIIRMWWPTGQRTSGVLTSYGRHLLGALLKRLGHAEHGYRFAGDDMPRLTINLKDRGRTEAIKVEEIDAPQPSAKVVRGKRVYWHNGQWWRELASGPHALGVSL